jgi:acyl carrier protein
MTDTEEIITREIEARAHAIGFPVQEIQPRTDLLKSGLYDSMSFIDLVVSIEDKCGIQIDLEQVSPAEIATVAQLKNLVKILKHA